MRLAIIIPSRESGKKQNHSGQISMIVAVSIGTGCPKLGAFGTNIAQVAKTLVAVSTETEETAERFQAMYQAFNSWRLKTKA